ncbi:MAG: hypothetical protein JJ858_17270 [Rhizobiaceae bacterium]|nr:hypothetical protein [Rhizobiaceae bacterium]
MIHERQASSKEFADKAWVPNSWSPDYIGNETIRTLGKSETAVTCSLDAAKALYPQSDIQGVSSFESACDAVLSGEASFFLVPVAYPKLNSFLMDTRLTIADYRIRPIPPLVLVGKKAFGNKAEFETIYLHPATEPLLKTSAIKYVNLDFCSSNEDVVERLGNANSETGGITNLMAASMAGFTPILTLRPEAPMGWFLLKRV